MGHLLDQGYDTVIYLDVDTVTVARLNEFLTSDYDIAGSLNIPADDGKYLNAGVMAVRNREFCKEWEDCLYDPRLKKSNQPSYNALVRDPKYCLKIVDEEDFYYNERSRDYWNSIEISGDKLICNGRWLKVLHWAGGFGLEHKLSYEGFSPEVRGFLNNVTGTTDFTDIKGEKRWW